MLGTVLSSEVSMKINSKINLCDVEWRREVREDLETEKIEKEIKKLGLAVSGKNALTLVM